MAINDYALHTIEGAAQTQPNTLVVPSTLSTRRMYLYWKESGASQ